MQNGVKSTECSAFSIFGKQNVFVLFTFRFSLFTFLCFIIVFGHIVDRIRLTCSRSCLRSRSCVAKEESWKDEEISPTPLCRRRKIERRKGEGEGLARYTREEFFSLINLMVFYALFFLCFENSLLGRRQRVVLWDLACCRGRYNSM